MKIKSLIKSIMLILLIGVVMFGYMTSSVAAAGVVVGGTIEGRKFSLTIPEGTSADTLELDFFSNVSGGFENEIYGDNDVWPGAQVKDASLEIINNSGEEYTISGFEVDAVMTSVGRLYADVAESAGLTKAETAALDADVWYQMNVDYFGEENFTNLDVLQLMFGEGSVGQGDWVGIETSQKMIDLGYYYLYSKIQLSFNDTMYPVSKFEVNPDITIWNLMNADQETKSAMLNEMIGGVIGENPIHTTVGYSVDYDTVGNAYKSARTDVRFTFTLTKTSGAVDLGTPEQPNPVIPITPEQEKPSTPVSSGVGPATGDTTMFGSLLLMAGASGIAFLTILNKRRN